MSRQFEGREKVFNFMTGRMMPVTVYYEYVPGRLGTYRAEVEEKINTITVASIGNSYDEAVERLQRRLQSLAS